MLEGFENIMFNQKEQVRLGKREPHQNIIPSQLKPIKQLKINKIGNLGLDQKLGEEIAKEMTKNQLGKHFTENKAFSTCGDDTEFSKNGVFINNGPITINFVQTLKGKLRKFSNNQKFRCVSPPNEACDANLTPVPPQHPIQPKVNKLPQIDRKMIQKYQKVDTFLKHFVYKNLEIPARGLFLRAILEMYFVTFLPEFSSELHQISKFNMNYILSLADDFTEREIRFMGHFGEFSNPEDHLTLIDTDRSEISSCLKHNFSFKSFSMKSNRPKETSQISQFETLFSRNDKTQITLKKPTQEELDQLDKEIMEKIQKLIPKFNDCVCGVLRYCYFYLNLREGGYTIPECVDKKLIVKCQLFLNPMNSRVQSLMMGFQKFLEKMKSISRVRKEMEDTE